MTYLHRQAEKRKDPARIMPGAKVAVVTLTNYFHGSTDPGRKPTDPGRKPGDPGLATGVGRASGRVAQYAWSADYHRVLGHRLERLAAVVRETGIDRKSTRLNSSHPSISYAVFCLKKKKKNHNT